MLVELWWGELSDTGVHSILNFQHNPVYAAHQEALEHAPWVIGRLGVLREGGGGQLLLIAHQDNFLGVVLEGDQVIEFYALASLVYNKVLYLATLKVF